ncbi:hypothetical protein L195_g015878 [Trifolium pratense]|uniref:Uncharacterized protein n=1 Tax=Trifolium pratense TaxID=57577 RepID=A0A2K3MPN8_TRIPR|nr:hypothetical protein L195_g015878 [Trifolium pratense]
MAHMDPASIRAAAHRERVAAEKARYDIEARAAALQYGSAGYPVRDYDELKEARSKLMRNHPRGTVQKVYIIKDDLNDKAVKNLERHAKDMADQAGYYVIFMDVHPDP